RRIYLWLMLVCFVLQCMTEPIGDHVLPQLICLMLLVWQFSMSNQLGTSLALSRRRSVHAKKVSNR
ncbi:MAG: hypothetical protein MJZ92_04755, partial [Paludibacteraceae bacterium]|nr:hypothetical protein [Paludibacteraceae bacterium]